jgi:hypothetical protein
VLLVVSFFWLAGPRRPHQPAPDPLAESPPAPVPSSKPAVGNAASRGSGAEKVRDPEREPAPAGAGKRYALLVGVKDYDHDRLRPLAYTEYDVVELAGVLRPAGYEVVLLTDAEGAARGDRRPTGRNIRHHLDAITAHCVRHDMILVAFAGHGLQFDTAKDSYFCPRDARPANVDTLVSLGDVYRKLDDSGAGIKLLLVDACRDDPLGSRGIDGAHVPRPPRGVAALFSCAAGQRAFETPRLGKKGHGVFFHFVLEGLRSQASNEENEITWDRLTEYVKRQVSRQVPVVIGAGAQQSPHQLANLVGESPVLLRRPLLVKAGPTVELLGPPSVEESARAGNAPSGKPTPGQLDTEKRRQWELLFKQNALRAQRDVSTAEIWSGQALNELLRLLTKQRLDGPSIRIDPDTLAKINVAANSSDNPGLLKQGGKLSWPLTLLWETFEAPRKRLGSNLILAVRQLKDKGSLAAATLTEIKDDLKTLENRLGDRAGDLKPAQYGDAKRYLDQLKRAVLTLASPHAAKYVNGTWTANGKDVADLVAHLNKHGLRFAPAAPGDEAAYQALYHRLAACAARLPKK